MGATLVLEEDVEQGFALAVADCVKQIGVGALDGVVEERIWLWCGNDRQEARRFDRA